LEHGELLSTADCEYDALWDPSRLGSNAMKLAHCGLMILLAAPCAAVAAQSQPAKTQNGQSETDTLAAAARRAREKQKDQPKAAKVWDNDNIPTTDGVDVVGPSAKSSATEASGSASAGNAGASVEETAESSIKSEKFDLEAQLKDAQENLRSLQSSLDFMQRKLALDQQSFYGNPNYSSDAAGAQALEDEQSQIDEQKREVAAAQKKVDDLTEKVKEAGAEGSGASGTK
jgi:hypothetical protein